MLRFALQQAASGPYWLRRQTDLSRSRPANALWLLRIVNLEPLCNYNPDEGHVCIDKGPYSPGSNEWKGEMLVNPTFEARSHVAHI